MNATESTFTPEVARDRDTGRQVIRLFPAPQAASHAYFTSTSYDAAGRLILSAQFGGRFQLCRVDLKRGTLHVLTALENMQPQLYCVSPEGEFAVIIDGNRLVKVELASCECSTLFTVPDGWLIMPPTVDAAGRRLAFAISEECPKFAATDVLYSEMAENFYFRPRSIVFTIDLDGNRTSAIWGETEWISHVLINPVDPNTVVFCHEGGGFADHRLWAVDARPHRKKQSTCLFREQLDEFLVHEYFLKNGTLGVQFTKYRENVSDAMGEVNFNSVLFLDMDGSTVANWRLPGARSGHVQSNSDNSLIVADRYYPDARIEPEESNQFLALNIPVGDQLKVERLCYSGTSWRTQLSHPHPIFSPDDMQILFSSETGGGNGVFIVDL